ncbi:hypothetical protein [Ancylobacter sp.]|uniref:hypothetical protein n=1 Tax=Ancylobacter sp. TaxID=1872567 RepID=UPI003D0BB4D6
MPKIATDDLLRSLIQIRETFSEMPLPLAIMLLTVAEREGATSSEIGRRVGVGRQYFRQLQRLGSGDYTGPGLNLVAALPHEDGRAVAIHLTKAGRRVLEHIEGGGSGKSTARS